MSKTIQSPYITEPTVDNFVGEVIERSSRVPVVVDFWAEWCQPCRILGPILEKLAVEYDGKFILAKANTEQMPDFASGFNVRSIPAVFALKGGKVVDSFVGVLPEAAIRAWLDGIMPTPVEILLAEASALEPTDAEAAGSKYREALALAPTEPLAKIGLGRVALALGRPAEARAIVDDLARRRFLEPEAETLKAELTLRGGSEQAGDLDTLKAAHAANPRDNEIQLKLAESLASTKRYDEALALALDLVERDRRGRGELARKLMLAVFQLLPPDSDLTIDYRRRLSFAL